MIYPGRGHHWEIRPGRKGQFCLRASGPRAELAFSEGLIFQWGPSQGYIIRTIMPARLFYTISARLVRLENDTLWKSNSALGPSARGQNWTSFWASFFNDALVRGTPWTRWICIQSTQMTVADFWLLSAIR